MRARIEAAAIGDAGQAIEHGEPFQFAVGRGKLIGHPLEMNGSGDLVGHRIEHRTDLAVEKPRPRGFDVEYAMQAPAIPAGTRYADHTAALPGTKSASA